MSRREKDKAKSLDALAKFAYASGGGAPPPAPRPSAPAPRPAPKPALPRPAAPAVETEADRLRRKQMEERKAKLDEERALRARRDAELARGANATWRGGGFTDIPASIRRTGFDRVEPSVAQKLHDILGEAREKESRAKNRDKGKRAGGKR